VGLNNQTIHHLFPQIDPVHYRAIQPILEKTSAEFNVPYKSESNLWEMIKLHVSYLGKINEFEQKTIRD